MHTSDELKSWLRKYESQKRIEHSERVAKTALSLYKIWGGNKEVLFCAGLLHDVARDLPFSSLIEIAERGGYKIDRIEYENPILLHGPAGAVLVEKELGIENEDILNCIRYHTTGRNNITLNEIIIYLSDYIEPGRDFEDANAVRKIAYSDLKEAVLEETRLNVNFLMKVKKPVHPRTIEMFDCLLKKELTKKEIKI